MGKKSPSLPLRIDLTSARCTDVDIVVAWGDLTTEMGTAGGPKKGRETPGKPWANHEKPRKNVDFTGKNVGFMRFMADSWDLWLIYDMYHF